MLGSGSKIKHVKSANFISEMVDSFNVAGLQMGGHAKISLIMGRDMLSVTQETLVPEGIGFQSQVLTDDMTIERVVVANLSIPLDAAKVLIVSLTEGVRQIEQNMAHAAQGLAQTVTDKPASQG